MGKEKIAFLFVAFYFLGAAAKQYPFVSVVVGESYEQKDSEKKIKFKKNDILKEKSEISTKKGSKIRIELDERSQLIVFENSIVRIPVITWGEGELSEIHLVQGKIRYNCEKNCNRKLVTALSSQSFQNGEYLLEYDPELTQVGLVVFHGRIEFGGLENEDQQFVESQHRIVFQGIKENGETAYDILLKGRKVARGQLLPIHKLPDQEFNQLNNTFDIRKDFVEKKVVKIIRTEKQICENPFGELNQCSWICESKAKSIKKCDLTKSDTKCIRRRCNANGQWADAQEMGALANKCQARPIVQECDY